MDVKIALVPLHVARQYSAPISRANRRSASSTTLDRDQTPLRRTGNTACSSASRKLGQRGKGVLRTGWPPRAAGTPALPPSARTSPRGRGGESGRAGHGGLEQLSTRHLLIGHAGIPPYGRTNRVTHLGSRHSSPEPGCTDAEPRHSKFCTFSPP